MATLLLLAELIGRLTSAQPAPAISFQPLLPSATNNSGLLFERLPAERTGLDFVYRWNPNPKYERLLNSSAVGGGVCVGDYDGDGLPDLCLTRPFGGHQLYRNLGDFHFTNVTERAGVRDDGVWTTGVSFVDMNQDGQLDLYVCCYDSPNRLYINQGNGTFVEQAKSYRLDFNGASFMMAFGDYDRDGLIDAYLLTGGLIPNPSQRFRVKFVEGRPMIPEELQEFWQILYLPGGRAATAEAGQLDHLFHNNGNGTFTDVSRAAGISGFDIGNAVVWWDYNGDGWPDLYVANDYFGPDHLYRNNGNGTFTDVAKESLPHTPWTSMGADVADVNNDGLLDLIASDMSSTTHRQRMIDMGDMDRNAWFMEWAEPRQYMRNALFLNTGTERFMEAAYLAGLASTDWTWSIIFGDLDNDGRVDLFVPNGMTRDWIDLDLGMQAKSLPPAQFADFWKAQPVRADRNLAFRNAGDLQFTETDHVWGLDAPGPSFGSALADLNGDGTLDLVVNDFEKPVRVYRNSTREQHRVKIQLRGVISNSFGLGATVRIQTAGGTQMRYLALAHGFMSAGEPLLHFGLGSSETIRQLTVEWPSGQQQQFADLPGDQLLTVTEPAVTSSSTHLPHRALSPTPVTGHTTIPLSHDSGYKRQTIFQRTSLFDSVRHEEEPFDDFKREPLLPWKLSQLGPGLAWGDVDGNGWEDLYVSGTTKKPGGLFLADGQGGSRVDSQPTLVSNAEEMAPLFIDANGDGYLDLYVVTGAAHSAADDTARQDRLYLNDGHGHFRPAPKGTLPDLRDSGSVVAAADFDQDGDIDLFLGGRCIPGKYPAIPGSYLLQNDGGKFIDVTDLLAPGLRRAGLVTSAVWSDTDNDGWLDLLVTCEWGPVKLFHNDHGHLGDQTSTAGLAERLGWWTAIAAADIDNDGDVDYVISNFGLNTRYQPSFVEPVRLYYGVFDINGNSQLLEATATGDRLLPIRGKGVLQKALPSLSGKFPTFRSFAEAMLPDIVGGGALAAAQKLEVNTSESGVLLNDGFGHFTFRSLPRIAQIAPAFGTVLADVDGDGHVDLSLAQNFYGPQPETGRMDGGVSLLLLGGGDGTFKPVWPNQSGLAVAGDAKSLTAVDLNGDGWVDFVIGVNNAGLIAFLNQGSRTNRMFAVKLRGKLRNPTAIGARVTVKLRDGSGRTQELYAGGGYLSQSSSVLAFGLGTVGQVERVEVHWPTGQVTHHQPQAGASVIEIQQPE